MHNVLYKKRQQESLKISLPLYQLFVFCPLSTMFSTPKGKGQNSKGKASETPKKRTPAKKAVAPTIKTRANKPKAASPAPAAKPKVTKEQEELTTWIQSMEPALRDAPSAQDMEASWAEQCQNDLSITETKVSVDTSLPSTSRGPPRKYPMQNVFQNLSASDKDDEPKDAPSNTGTSSKEKKRVSLKSCPIAEEEEEESEDDPEDESWDEEGEPTLIHEIDLEPMDLNESQREMMQSHIRDIIDLILYPSSKIILEMRGGIFSIYQSAASLKLEHKPAPPPIKKRKEPIPKKPVKEAGAYSGVFNSESKATPIAGTMVKITVFLKTTKKKVSYVVPRADDGTPESALKNYMRSKGKTDWALRNLDYKTAKIN